MKVSDFIGMLFLARDVAHRVHLSTRSYSKHMALDGFYHDIVEMADKFAESYQGKHGLITIPLLSAKNGGNIVAFLEDQAAEIEKGRDGICEDSTLQNIIDEILGLYFSTIYKLKFLA